MHTPEQFKIAIANTLGMSRYETPGTIERTVKEWLIVTRFGASGEFITISDAGQIAADIPEETPPDIAPENTMLGIHLRTSPDGNIYFLLVRRHQEEGNVEGKFFPVDGVAVIETIGDKITLRASGRHIHNQFGEDVPYPAPDDPEVRSMAWHFDGVQHPWQNQSL